MNDEEFNRLYPEEYYSHRLKNPSEVRKAKIIADAIYYFFKPSSVVDLGCGVAMELYHLKERGIEVKGIDRSPYAKKHGCISEVETWDLGKSYPFSRRYDVGLCFDAIEHLEPEFEVIALDNLVNSSDNVLLAVPWKVGDPLHFNEQPPEYWVKQLGKLGYNYEAKGTEYLKNMMRGGRLWVVRNLQFFTARKDD